MIKRKDKPTYFPCWLKSDETIVTRISPRITYVYDHRSITIKGHRTFEQAFRAARALGLNGKLDLFRA